MKEIDNRTTVTMNHFKTGEEKSGISLMVKIPDNLMDNYKDDYSTILKTVEEALNKINKDVGNVEIIKGCFENKDTINELINTHSSSIAYEFYSELWNDGAFEEAIDNEYYEDRNIRLNDFLGCNEKYLKDDLYFELFLMDEDGCLADALLRCKEFNRFLLQENVYLDGSVKKKFRNINISNKQG